MLRQVLDRLKACSAYIQLAQGFTKSTKTAEQKIAKAAAKLNKLQGLQDLQVVATAAAEAAQLARQQSLAAAQVWWLAVQEWLCLLQHHWIWCLRRV